MSNFSYFAIKTIIFFEIKDYFREFQFNIIAPLITTFLFVFILSTLDRYYILNNIPGSYINYLIPGIVMLVVIQTSFNHLSELIINMKQIGSFNDFLISPISRIELFIALVLSSTFVCMIVGFINLFFLSLFTKFETLDLFSLLYYLIVCIIIFSSIGALTGFLSFTWDVKSSVSNFFIIPISFLSGTFFSIDNIDSKFLFLFEYNPVYYLISGFRNSFFLNESISFFGETSILLLFFISIIITLFIFKKGYRVIN